MLGFSSSRRFDKTTTLYKNLYDSYSNHLKFKLKKNINENKDEMYVGNGSLDLMPIKVIYIHLLELNTSQNYFNGAGSTVLCVVPIENREFGDVITARFEQPEYKSLVNDTISELKLEARDEKNNKINNNGFPISCVLEII